MERDGATQGYNAPHRFVARTRLVDGGRYLRIFVERVDDVLDSAL